ncbi:MAG: hypothetical protein PHY47_22390 [Lachnospiraceae bacterium]|nr:hypothetical protein [Lachnospiraceae bacterium]
MAQKSYDERLLDIAKKKEQLDAQEKAIKKRQSEDERKKRTRRLRGCGQKSGLPKGSERS